MRAVHELTARKRSIIATEQCVNCEDVIGNVIYDDHSSSRFAGGATATRGVTVRTSRITTTQR